MEVINEAAQIDSANAWQILWKITIPIIKPIVLSFMGNAFLILHDSKKEGEVGFENE